MADLNGTKILITVTNYGIEQDELTVPLRRLRDMGADVTLAATDPAPIQTLVGDKDPGETLEPDIATREAKAEGYDLLVIPGGTINADTLRTDEDAVALVKAFAQAGKPVAAICHGPWLLVEAGVAHGKNLTSYPTLKTDIRNAGGDWADEEVRVCRDQGFTTITSRNPGDLDAFVGAIADALAPVNA